MTRHILRTAPLLLITIAVAAISACSRTHTYTENSMSEPIALSPRLQELFSQTKLACFGRYALAIPKDAELITGNDSFPSDIDLIPGGAAAQERQILDDIAKIKFEDDDAEILFNGRGPLPNSREIRYYKSIYSKARRFYIAKTYVNLNDWIFVWADAPRTGESESDVLARILSRAKSLRLRNAEEVPSEAGYCLKHGFISSALYNDQEMTSAGIYLHRFPDVTFSISSNKDAYGDYSSEEFEQRVRGELSLLARIKGAQDIQGIRYPRRTVLREGKRAVQHWRGEESLIKRADGTHDFEWAFVGTPRDVANPSEYSVHMYTKVAHNTVGAADKASLSDDEAVALWDKLLSGLKFRVKVPGAPEGSYYLAPGAATGPAPK